MPTKESKADFGKLLTRYPPTIRAIAEKLRVLVLKVFPDAFEKTYWGWSNTWYGLSEKSTDMVFSINPIKSYVQLYFISGTELSDPDKLLEGTGKKLRHVNFRSAADLNNPALIRLMKRAVAHGKRKSNAEAKSRSKS